MMCPDGCHECCICFDVEVFPEDFVRYPDLYVMDDGLTMKIAGEKCLYLKDGQCSIYEFRPNVCRQYFCENDDRVAISSRTENCHNEVNYPD